MLWVALHFHALPLDTGPGTLGNLAAWACQFTPKVSLEPPQALLAEVQGSLRYFGGLDAFLGRLRAGLGELGLEACVAVGATPRAALWRARGGHARLEELPVEVVSADPFFKSVGIATVGELLGLPREGLARRCGQPLVDDLDRALGTLAEPREFFAPPSRFDASLELPGEVRHAEGVLFAARRLIVQLEGLLAARHAGLRRFCLFLIHNGKKSTGLEINFASPTRDAERMASMLRERLAGVVLGEGVEAIRLEAMDFTPLHERTAGLFGDAQADGEAWAKLAERLEARLGNGAIHGLTTQPDHRPEHAWRRVEPGEWDPREFVQPGPRPAWLLDPARRVPKKDYELLAGPERIECGWWDGDEARRDYFIARSGASLVWIYRERSGQAEEWFLHGFFA